MKSRDIWKLVLVATVAACIPVVVVWFQARRPLDEFSRHAKSQEEIHKIVMTQGKALIERELKQNVRDTTTYADIKARWQVIRGQMLRAGASRGEADDVLYAVRSNVSPVAYRMPAKHWPIFAKKGLAGSTPIWVVTIAWPKPPHVTREPDEPDWNSQTMMVDFKNDQQTAIFGVLP